MSLPVPILDGLLDMGNTLFKSLFPDPKQAEDAQIKFLQLIQNGKFKKLETAANVIMSEANSESWITRSWRPITMLTFVALIAMHWLGFTAENLSPKEIENLMELVKIGLGGYVVSRGAEKAIKEWKK